MVRPKVDVSSHFICLIEDLDVGSFYPIGFFNVANFSHDVSDFFDDWIQQPWEKMKNLRLVICGEFCEEDGSFFIYPKNTPLRTFYGSSEKKSPEELL